jgi:hypothetical protein
VTDHHTPRDRLIQVAKWYLSAFHAGRKSAVPKKPYNPILGETFQCAYDIGTSSSNVSLILMFKFSLKYLICFIDNTSQRWSSTMGIG